MEKSHNKFIVFFTALVMALGLYAAPAGAVSNSASPVAERVLSVEIEEATIFELQHAMQKEGLTSEELVQFYLNQIEEYDDSINSIITVDENVLEEAKQLDKERKAGKVRGPLHGIPVILKDNYDTYDMQTTAGSLSLEGSIPLKDAYQTKRLRDQGAIILGKANLHEFAFGFQTISSLGGQTYNPYDLTRYPGGSSGGTAAAVASNFAAVGLGTDTGGSIRIPSSFNNLVGLRPTMGLASRDGIIPLALSQDVGGPMGRTVEDVAVVLDAIAGYDPADPITEASIGKVPKTYTHYLKKNGLKKARIGVIRDLFGNDPEVNKVMDQVIADMEALGAEVFEVTVPSLRPILSYPSLSGYEFKFQLNDYLAGLGPDAPVRTLSDIIDSGKFHPSLESGLKSRNERESLENDEEYQDIVTNRPKMARESLMATFNEHDLDALLYPTSSALPAQVGNSQGAGNANRLSPYSGFPAISVPAGFSDNGLPVGLELLGKEFDEPTLIKLAYAYQEGTNHRKAPELK